MHIRSPYHGELGNHFDATLMTFHAISRAVVGVTRSGFLRPLNQQAETQVGVAIA